MKICSNHKVWIFREGHKIWKNLRRTFDKSVVFYARNTVLVKKSTKIFQNKCGQVVLYKLYKSGFFNKKLPRHKPHLQLTKNSSHHKLFFFFFWNCGNSWMWDNFTFHNYQFCICVSYNIRADGKSKDVVYYGNECLYDWPIIGYYSM